MATATLGDPVIINLDHLSQATIELSKGAGAKTADGRKSKNSKNARQSKRKRDDSDYESEIDSADEVEKEEVKPKKSKREPSVKLEDGAKKRSKIIASIDIGMSGSGLCIATVDDDVSNVKAETRWEGLKGDFAKVESAVAFREDNQVHPSFTDAQKVFFAHRIPRRAKSRAFFKTSALEPGAQMGSFDDVILNASIASKLVDIQNADANREALTAYLGHMRRVLFEKLEMAKGRGYLEHVDIVYVITHPAACTKQGLERLCTAVEHAGFSERSRDETKYMSEAHASVVAAFQDCLKEHKSKAWRKEFKKNTFLAVVDIGGLTVDVSVCKILANDPMPKLEELYTSDGGKSGLVAVHCRILDKLASLLGSAFSKLEADVIGRGSEFCRELSLIIQSFDGSELKGAEPCPLKLLWDIERREVYDHEIGELKIARSMIKEAFDETTEYIKALLDHQFQREDGENKIQTVLFSGGGALNKYVYDILSGYCRAKWGVSTFPASGAESTVCRGATMCHMRPSFLGKRRSRASFGMEVIRNGQRQLYFFVRKGASIDTTKKASIHEINGNFDLTRSVLGQIINQKLRLPLNLYMFEGAVSDSSPMLTSESAGIGVLNGVIKVADIIICKDTFSRSFAAKLRRQMKTDADDTATMRIGVSMAANREGRLYFEARTGVDLRATIGRGTLRLTDTE